MERHYLPAQFPSHILFALVAVLDFTLNSSYMAPTDRGYSTEMHPETVRKYEYPHGAAWRQMFRDRTYWDPSLEQKLLVPDREILH